MQSKRALHSNDEDEKQGSVVACPADVSHMAVDGSKFDRISAGMED